MIINVRPTLKNNNYVYIYTEINSYYQIEEYNNYLYDSICNNIIDEKNKSIDY